MAIEAVLSAIAEQLLFDHLRKARLELDAPREGFLQGRHKAGNLIEAETIHPFARAVTHAEAAHRLVDPFDRHPFFDEDARFD